MEVKARGWKLPWWKFNLLRNFPFLAMCTQWCRTNYEVLYEFQLTYRFYEIFSIIAICQNVILEIMYLLTYWNRCSNTVKRPQKWINLPPFLTLLSNIKTKWKINSNFFCLLRISEFQKRCWSNKNFTPLWCSVCQDSSANVSLKSQRFPAATCPLFIRETSIIEFHFIDEIH